MANSELVEDFADRLKKTLGQRRETLVRKILAEGCSERDRIASQVREIDQLLNTVDESLGRSRRAQDDADMRIPVMGGTH
jgi:hypothetical protein